MSTLPTVAQGDHVIEEYDWLLIPGYEYYKGWCEYRRFNNGGHIRWETLIGPEWHEIDDPETCAELESMFQHWLMAQHMAKKED